MIPHLWSWVGWSNEHHKRSKISSPHELQSLQEITSGSLNTINIDSVLFWVLLYYNWNKCNVNQQSKMLLLGSGWCATANLGFYIQNSNFALIVDLLDCLKSGAKHVSLEAAILQQLISRDAFGHCFIGDEEILLSILLILSLGSGGVCAYLKLSIRPLTVLQTFNVVVIIIITITEFTYAVQGKKTFQGILSEEHFWYGFSLHQGHLRRAENNF